jgi:uncharacterized lipoprotein
MNTRTAACTALLALVAVTGLAACSSDKSEEEIATDCQKALASGTQASATDWPDACKGLSQDDYDALRMSEALKDTGIIDENGNVDPDELLGEQ